MSDIIRAKSHAELISAVRDARRSGAQEVCFDYTCGGLETSLESRKALSSQLQVYGKLQMLGATGWVTFDNTSYVSASTNPSMSGSANNPVVYNYKTGWK